ncbi:MAG: VCBS repeat-containing protein [Candidatus Midichloria sp.]|nr:VCBS repeat-containing protein [Candidatus Midichloria sp.]
MGNIFSNPVFYGESFAYPQMPTVADFNRDGKLDIAVTNETKTGVVTIMHGNGDGIFPIYCFLMQ